MPVIHFSSSYITGSKKFVKNNPHRVALIAKALSLFRRNPSHPSLHIEKLQGKKGWTIRLDQGHRIFFTWIDEKTALFFDIGSHDKYRKY